MLRKEDCFFFGQIFKLHGYKGAVNIYNEKNVTLKKIEKIEYFLIDFNNILTPYFIDRIQLKNKNILLVKFEDITTEDQALKILKKEVFLPKNMLNIIDHNKILEGYRILEKKLGDIGVVLSINQETEQKLIIGLSNKNEKQFYIPFHKKFIIKINHKTKEIEVDIPRELIELN